MFLHLLRPFGFSRQLLLLLISLMASRAHAQYVATDSSYTRCFIGTSAFVLYNLNANDRPDFAQLNFGYRLTPQDALSVEVKTWKYDQPLGIPYGSSFTDPNEKFPGCIREVGFALAYQHFWWKGLYSAVHVMSAWQRFLDEEGARIDKGYQIFNTYRLGCHVKLFKQRFFIEPSLAVTHRPYHTEMPDSFRKQDDKWSKFFLPEPGLHLGINF